MFHCSVFSRTVDALEGWGKRRIEATPKAKTALSLYNWSTSGRGPHHTTPRLRCWWRWRSPLIGTSGGEKRGKYDVAERRWWATIFRWQGGRSRDGLARRDILKKIPSSAVGVVVDNPHLNACKTPTTSRLSRSHLLPAFTAAGGFEDSVYEGSDADREGGGCCTWSRSWLQAILKADGSSWNQSGPFSGDVIGQTGRQLFTSGLNVRNSKDLNY